MLLPQFLIWNSFASVFKKYKQPLMDLFQLIQKDDPTVQSVSVYGELFGGGYPHPDVQADESVQLVQTGVYYCPGLDFCAFDITTSTGPASSRTYLPYTRCLELFTTVGLFHAAILFSGSYEDCLKYPIRFESTIPARLGLPKLATSNVAEGVVIKSDVPVFVDTPKGPVRAIVKKKIPDFAEEMDNQDKNREASDLTSQISSMITINRLKNVISKYGRINPKDQKQKTELIHLMKEDIIGDLKEKGKNVDRDQFKFADDAIRKCIDDFCKQK
eukprot:TRINITY_DN4389_c0_g1_i2.p1 TRINITY_DN4389_c0_g1~~TRINITY_DN4389_c0_g1_i2.p1  ORF type:complete len:273 (-),score=64.08 TRINITY_DN4389_c0_g1_i2:29-847(-)